MKSIPTVKHGFIRASRSPARLRKWLLAGIGSAMLCAAIVSLAPTEPAASGIIPGYNYRTAERLSNWNNPRLQRLDGESDLALTERLTTVVHGAVFHCDPGDYRDLATRWALALMPEQDASEGLLNPKFINCGFCHQVAYILAGALMRQGVNASVYGLNGHVVTLIQIGNSRYIADPDLGVGPIAYDAGLWSRARDKYQEVPHMTASWMQQLQSIVDPIHDDGPYYSMADLKQLENRQNLYVRWTRALMAFVGAVGLTLIVLSLFAFRQSGIGRQ